MRNMRETFIGVACGLLGLAMAPFILPTSACAEGPRDRDYMAGFNSGYVEGRKYEKYRWEEANKNFKQLNADHVASNGRIIEELCPNASPDQAH